MENPLGPSSHESFLPTSQLDGLPREVALFASAMARRHGSGRLAMEANGLHLYIPCPTCLEEKGARELDSRHMTINLDKYFCRNKFRRQPKHKADSSAICHKNPAHKFKVSDLMAYEPIVDRGYDPQGLAVVSLEDDSLVDDGKGNKVPRPPGKVISLVDLPEDHHARTYVEQRGFSCSDLVYQFDASYCFEEHPEQPAANGSSGYGYRRLGGDWKDTPQGRIIFNIDIYGVRKGWQARIIDTVHEGWKFYWHPYRNEWEGMEYLDNDGNWVLREPYASMVPRWNPSKYRTAKGCHRNSALMGFDAAVRWNSDRGDDSVVFVVEGPLDAARIGPPACAILGKTISYNQAKLLRTFRRIVFVPDNDDAGKTSLLKAQSIFGSLNMDYEICEVNPRYKDIGAMPKDQADLLLSRYK